MSLPLSAVEPEGGRLTIGERLRLAKEILAAYVRVRWWMARRELPAVVEAIRSRESESEGPVPYWNCRRLGDAVTRLLMLLPTDSRCLVRSLVLLSLLHARGETATVIIGVKPAPSFAAHAWIERDGRPLLSPGQDFGRLLAI